MIIKKINAKSLNAKQLRNLLVNVVKDVSGNEVSHIAPLTSEDIISQAIREKCFRQCASPF